MHIYRDYEACFSAFVDIKDWGGGVMSEGQTYAVVDFEANGFPRNDGNHTACFHFLKTYASRNPLVGNYNNKLNAIFLELDGSFQAMQWGSIEDTEQFESNFTLIWTNYKKNEDWKDELVKKALEFLNTDFQWRVLTISKGENKIKHYLCYQDDLVKKQGLFHKSKPFRVEDKEHRKLVLNLYFGPTILSCALLHMEIKEGKIDIIRHAEKPYFYAKSRSENDRCYYQVYKPDEHYIHSSEAETIHNLSQEWIQKNGQNIMELFEQFIYLSLNSKFKGRIKFVAHNAAADQQYLLDAIDKYISLEEYRSEINGTELNIGNLRRMRAYVHDRDNWFCTYKAVRGTLQNCSLSSVYKHYTSSNMPKKHDAQMDVYACATIFCHLKKVQDQSELIDLIGKIESTEIICQKPMDFWRHARMRNAKQAIKADDYIDLKNWSICLKWDGFYVRLKRESPESDKWRMHTRSGNELHPPKSFLISLRSIKFPVGMEMEGELVFDSDQTCEPANRNNVEKRIRKRTQDFAKLHISSLRSTKSFTSWHGLRLVLFAFPVMGQPFRVSFKNGKKLIVDSKDQHEHITACGYYRLKSTKEAFDIFMTVVQMGCEGVIVRDPNALYENRAETDKRKSKVFKMKQKIVTDNEQRIELVEVSGQPRRKKDGTEKEEIEYKVTAFKVHDTDRACEFTFKDWRNAEVGPNGVVEQKLKFHEKARWKMAWDLNEKGYRHTCFATDQDVSYPVPANSEYNQEILNTIKNHIFVVTKPFKFIVETAYVFLDCFVHQNHVVHNTDKERIEIGMLRLIGKTDEEIQPQWFLHREYVRDNCGPIDKQLVSDMTQFLHHIPNDNKRLVFVVQDKLVLKNFKTYTEEIMRDDRYNRRTKDTILRLEINDKARKQQIDVILMEEWKAKKLFKTLISWNTDRSAGYITEYDDASENNNRVRALVSPELSDEKFKTICDKQFNNCVLLQNIFNGCSQPIKPARNEIVLADIDALQLEKLPSPHTPDDKLAPYLDQLKSLKLYSEEENKIRYNILLEYDQGKETHTGIITREDFEKAFEVARRREKSCPNDPFEPLTGKFPYFLGHKNVWHRAWRMSEAFFRFNKMVVSGKTPDVFKSNPDLDLWLPVHQPVVRAPLPEVEIVEEERPEKERVVAEYKPKKIEENRPTAPAAKSPKSTDNSGLTIVPKTIHERVGTEHDRETGESSHRAPKKPKPEEESGKSPATPAPTFRPSAPAATTPKSTDNFGLTINPQILHERRKATGTERHRETGESSHRAPKKPKPEETSGKSPGTPGKKDVKEAPKSRPSGEEWLKTQPTPRRQDDHTSNPESPEVSQKTWDWLEEQMKKTDPGTQKKNKSELKMKALLEKLKLFAL